MLTFALLAALAGQASVPHTTPSGPGGALVVVIETDARPIRVRLDPVHAPVTVANFLRYIEEGFYDRTSFYRTVTIHPDNQPDKAVKIEVIQGGASDTRPTHAPIPLERTSDTGLKHVDGTISMARDGPDTATTEFFICIGDQPELDFGGHRNPDGQGFAAFGRVIEGMDVVRRIQRGRVDGQRLDPPVAIARIVVER
jgi:peptidyl-prolyl cis-trans isomerase A (cyclophilin A)